MIMGIWFLCYLGRAAIDSFFKYFTTQGKYLFLVEPYQSPKDDESKESWLDEDQQMINRSKPAYDKLFK